VKRSHLQLSLSLLLLLLLISSSFSAVALADDPIIGEMRLFAGPESSVPAGWMVARGQLLNNDDYPELYALIGTTYGSGLDNNFRLPGMEGRVVVAYNHTGGDAEFDTLGEIGGAKTHTLTVNEMPGHTHGTTHYATSNEAAGYGLMNTGTLGFQNRVRINAGGAGDLTQSTGGGQAHNNLQPYIVLNYIIYVGGISAPTPTPTPTATPTPGPGGQQTGPISGTITGSLVITNPLPFNAYTTTLTTGNDFVWLRSASYGEIIAGSGVVMVVLVVIFYLVGRYTTKKVE
jgi:microcystin-dependent protein